MKLIKNDGVLPDVVDDSIDIEPDVVTNGKVYYKLEIGKSEALVIHCGDIRFQAAIRRFINEELGIIRYSPIVIGGGAHAFGMQAFLPKNFKILWEQIKFHIRGEKIRQVVLINHEDCAWYDKMKGYHLDLPVVLKGKLDLKKAVSILIKDFGKIRVRAFWAGIKDDSIYFDEL